MAYETLCAALAPLLLLAIGLGPARWWFGGGSWSPALAAAPALGLAITGLVAFPLVRYGAPVRLWAWPVTGLLAGMSLGLALRLGRRDPGLSSEGTGSGVPWWAALLAPGCAAVLMLPALVKGIDYAAFRSNPADAFSYVSLAESYRTVPWADLLAGGDLTDLEAMRRLGEKSPSALLTARFLHVPLPLPSSLPLAWLADLFRAEAYRFYFAYHALCLALMAPLLGELGRRLSLPPVWAWGASVAVVLGFWSRFLLETDAGAHIAGMPLLLLALLAWLGLTDPGAGGRSSVLFGVAGAALMTFNLPIAAVLGVAAVLYYASSAAAGRPLGAELRLILLAGVATAACLGLAAQWPLILGGLARAGRVVGEQAAFDANFTRLLRLDGPAGFWGLPIQSLLKGMDPLKLGPLLGIAQVLGVLATLGAILGGARAFGKGGDPAARLVFSVAAAGLVWFVLLSLQSNHRAAGKACQYVYPLTMLAAAWGLHGTRFRRWPRAAPLAAVGWLAALTGLGMVVPFRSVGGLFARRAEWGGPSLDVDPIRRALGAQPSGPVATYVPPTTDWVLPYFCHLAFARVRARSMTGLVLDNTTKYQTLALPPSPASPAYVVVARDADFIAGQRLGERLAEAPSLVLYRVNHPAPVAFAQAEAAFRGAEARKPRKLPDP